MSHAIKIAFQLTLTARALFGRYFYFLQYCVIINFQLAINLVVPATDFLWYSDLLKLWSFAEIIGGILIFVDINFLWYIEFDEVLVGGVEDCSCTICLY